MDIFTKAADVLLRPAAVVVIPTDTVYGLAARAADKAAVERLYGLKKRVAQPGTIIAANIEQLVELGIKQRYLKAVEQFWPNPLSVIIPCANPDVSYLHQGKMSLAVRIPKNKALCDLLLTTGPLLTSSANHPKEEPANTRQEAEKYFGDTVDLYVDGGDLSGHEPSTIIRIVDDAIELIREGAVAINESGRVSET